jgi:hypothetical protein
MSSSGTEIQAAVARHVEGLLQGRRSGECQTSLKRWLDDRLRAKGESKEVSS